MPRKIDSKYRKGNLVNDKYLDFKNRKSLAAKKVQDPDWLLRKNSTVQQEKLKRKYDYFLILPDDQFKGIWDILITVFILFVCITAPW